MNELKSSGKIRLKLKSFNNRRTLEETKQGSSLTERKVIAHARNFKEFFPVAAEKIHGLQVTFYILF